MAIHRPLSSLEIEKGRIGYQQLFFLIITFIISTADIIPPQLLAEIAHEDAWISVLIATAMAAATAWIAAKLQLRIGRRNIADAADTLFGHILGRMVSFYYIFVFILLGGVALREINEVLLNVFLDSTPMTALAISMILLVAYGVHHKLEVFCRVNEILTPLGILTLILVILFNVTEIHFQYFLPIFYDGIMPSIYGAIILYCWLSQVSFIILMAGPHLRTIDSKLPQVGISAVLVVGVMLMLGVLAIAIFGAERTAQFQFPALEIVRNIDVFDFIQRLDAFILGIWVGGIAIKIIAIYYFACMTMSQWFRIRNINMTIAPVGLLTVLISILAFADMQSFVHFIRYYKPTFTIIATIGIPILMLIVSYWRKVNEMPIK
ncbi:hypothetical protein BHU72_01270 [Desulfuribacillus stibiiarsenatis]|uniref:Uncharacterized protein n=1 Tax=Desulfuribacillus stibiiarsenatis TaxID=1390249 RepID=A0A1E5L9V2_9FIRM|nr:endospore germination permease [Desulfuribacillus stibiiarsenatis]OEH86920.1 hypothetical protein BHU72_01270 [Desulfuribacillus stibiiarsenatis]